MSKALSLKMDDAIFKETESLLHKIHVPRNAYINRAVDFYNRWQKRQLTKKKLQNDVKILREDTLEFLKTFDSLQDLLEE